MGFSIMNNIKNKMLKVNVDKFIDTLMPLEDMTAFNLMIKISTLSKENIDKVLQREDVKNKLSVGLLEEAKEDFYEGFRRITNYFTVEQVFSLFNVKVLKSFFINENRYHEYKLFVVLMEKNMNSTIKYILNDDEMFDEFFKQSNNFYSLFSDVDYELIKAIIFKMGENIASYQNDFISIISSESQIKLLNENISDKMLVYMLPFFRESAISEFFCKDPRAFYLFEQFNIRNFVLKGVKFSDEILKKKEFFNKLKSMDFVYFRKIINVIEKYNNADIIERRLNSYYDEIISLYDEKSDMLQEHLAIANEYISSGFSIYGSKEKAMAHYKDLTSKKLSEVIIDALFQDNIYNVWLNIKEMLRYNSKLTDNEKVISKEREEFYKKILDFDNIPSKEKIELFHKLRYKRVNFLFYDDLRKLKDLSYDMIKKSLFNVSNKNNDINIDSELSNKYGVNIYDMREKEFTMLIRGLYSFREEYMNRRNCYSIIGNDNSIAYGSCDGRLIYYGYNTFDNDKVMHVLEQDSYSSDIKDELSSKYVNRIMTSDELIKNSTWYSEIDLVNAKSENGKYTAKRPDYIVFYDNGKSSIKDNVNEAKRLNIPIVIIKETKLSEDKKLNVSFDREEDYYIDDASLLNYKVRNEGKTRK